MEGEVADWVDHPDHSTSLSVEQHPIAEFLPAFRWLVVPTQDGDGLGVDLREHWLLPRSELWDINENPGLCPQP